MKGPVVLTKLQQLLTFLPEAAVVPASYVIVVALIALVMMIAFKIALRLVATLVGTLAEARRLAWYMSFFTGGGAAIPITGEKILGFIQSAL